MSTQGGYVCAIIADSLMWWLFGKRYPLHMRVYVYRTREITNAEKNGRLPCGRKYGNAIASYLRNEAIKTPNSFWSQQDTKSVSMSSLSLSCVSRR